MAAEEPYAEEKIEPMNGLLDGAEEKAAALHHHQQQQQSMENNEEEEEEEEEEEMDLFGLLNRVNRTIFCAEPRLLSERIKIAFSENLPLLKEASRNTGRKVILWTRRGSPLRALLVICVGTMALLALTGWLIFMLFFLAATVNAIVISLLMSLAAAGGFLFLFFASVTAVYVAALSVAVLVISTATISAIVAVVIAAGWIGFFLTVWLVTKKSFNTFKHSLSVTASAISSYSAARHGLNHRKLD